MKHLLEVSAPFRDGWLGHDIEGCSSRERVVHHPADGVLRFGHHRLAPAGHPDPHPVVQASV
ncbi:hypothetical protein [Streptomyces sp. VRA16 Mangrove soil]|uniref:MmyB family transcriptional regulator n=1 Tax=Streptomyces sp. VRA16 Mangrove soil TaxID=2817434 RepID=UPI0027DE3347|nr:hypothetical protein [Streptomyces sp. VRA16 Mangrove soil]